MVSKIIQFVIVFALIALVINIFPKVSVWLADFFHWVLSFGKWGVIALASLCVLALVEGFR